MLRAARHDRTCANMPPVAALERAPPTRGALEPQRNRATRHAPQREHGPECRQRRVLVFNLDPRRYARGVGRGGDLTVLTVEEGEGEGA